MINAEHRIKVRRQIEEWTNKYMGTGFKFRPHQYEAVESIILNVLENESKPVHIVEAPTGAGKSNIFVISAGVLNHYYHKTSYILCSDLYLWKQYKQIIDNQKLPFGALMGQTGNYVCNKNGEDVRNGECRMAKIPWTKMIREPKEMERMNFECSFTCEYLRERVKAQEAGVTLMTYQLFLYMINIVGPQCVDTHGCLCGPFKERDVIFCDECHNIPSIIQSQYGPNIRYEHLSMFEKIYNYNCELFTGLFKDELPITNLQTIWADAGVMGDRFETYWRQMLNMSRSKIDDYNTYISFVEDFVNVFNNTVEYIEESIAEMRRNNRKITKNNIEIYKACSWYRNFCCLLTDFGTAISDAGSQYLIKQVNVRNSDNELSVNFNCVKEDYMCYRYLLSKTGTAVLTSATPGDKDAFEENIGVHYFGEDSSIFERIPSTFNFDNSPIYVSSKCRFNYDNRFNAIRIIRGDIYEIVKNVNFRGIIQTGSYDNALNIFDNAPKEIKQRMYMYSDSRDKQIAMSQYKMDPRGILIGPTLIEGIDLPDNLCRYIIIAKVPYPNLGDKLVNAKKDLFPKWYQSETANSIIQGIGRGVRNPEDWCYTFILDACFLDLYRNNKNQFGNEFSKRLKIH